MRELLQMRWLPDGKEAQGLAGVEELRSHLQTLDQLHHWLYTEHAAYALGKVPKPLQTKALETY